MLLVIWKRRQDNSYYWKAVKGFYSSYYIGYINQYNHEIVLTINLEKEILHKPTIQKRVITKTISLLHKLEKKL